LKHVKSSKLIFKVGRGFGKLKFENGKSKIEFVKTILISIKNTQASNKMSVLSIEQLLDIAPFTKFKEEFIDKITEKMEKQNMINNIIENEEGRVQFGEYPTAQTPPPSPTSWKVPEGPDLRNIKYSNVPLYKKFKTGK
jgi:hypothetical protein